ncbi:MAG: hypothetical protein H6742_07990 [Alphaproteobacteria bacterium]|nr:hypothetical protein [Alphaproteobacteria bacterium]
MRTALLLLLPLLACSRDKGAGPTDDDSGDGTTEGTGDSDGAGPLPAPDDGLSAHFATSGTCAECHSNHPDADALRADDGSEVGMADLWQASMMANALRDPLFRAVVSAEVARHPSAREVIEDTCLTCHAPMARTEAVMEGTAPLSMASATAEDDLGMIGLDGVSCATCHKIRDEGLGEEESFTGGYVIDDSREIYGPHADPFQQPMQEHVDFTPVESDQVTDPGLCGTCHTLRTETLVDGLPTGHSLQEQAPYLEWRSSGVGPAGSNTSCQDCHVPTRDGTGSPIETMIARSPMGHDIGRLEPRSPVGQHSFLGGNVVVPALLRDHAATLSPRADEAAFDAHLARTREFLGERAATLSIGSAVRRDGVVQAEVRVTPLTGHKLPTGHPSRRAWLVVTAVDAGGRAVFEVGAVDDQGRIVDGDGVVLPQEQRGGGVHPHRDRVDDDAGPQVWQSVMADVDGAPTWALLSGASWLKDDRLLPAGWAPSAADLDRIAPVGVDDDDDFGPGGDVVTVSFAASGPVELTASLVYQPISPRYVDELAASGTPAVGAFLEMWATADRTPVVLAEDVVSVD